MSLKIHLSNFVYMIKLIIGDVMSDLRVKKTKELIKGAFIELVEEKGFDNVTVKDICSKAQINRNTFYLHYYDKIDLLTKLASEIFIEQESSLSITSKDSITDDLTLKKSIIHLLKVLYKEIEFYRVILLDSNMSGYINSFELELKKRYIKIFNINYEKHKMNIDFLFYGISGVIKNWIIKDYASIEVLSSFITDLLIKNAYIIIK